MLSRVSEKSVELNFCAQLNAHCGQRLLWFGLTQAEEARLGFDACTRMNGRLVIFQFKASNHDVKGGRRFLVSHAQMQELRKRVRTFMRSVYYAFPLIGSFRELATNSDFIIQTWLMDVATLPALPIPTTRFGTVRKRNIHYVDVVPHLATIRSDPIEVPLLSINAVVGETENQDPFPQADGVRSLVGETFETFWAFRRLLARTSAAVFVPHSA